MNDQEFNIRIAKVRELTAQNHINRWEMMRSGQQGGISVTLKSRFTMMPAQHCISLSIGAVYSCTRHLMRQCLVDYNIELIFETDPYPSGMEYTNGRLLMNPRLMTLMYSAGIGALRGMLAMKVAGTFLRDFPLPLINISALVSEHIYGTKPADNIVPLVDFVYN